ncbi:MAG: sulfurtransferase [Arenimonas sp.]
MASILNIAAYRFIAIADPVAVVARVRALCETQSLRGSVLVAEEGINLFLAGSPEGIHAFLAGLGEDQRFADLPVKFSESEAQPFKRLKVKLKREIITFGAPPAQPADSLAPGQLRDWLRSGRDDKGREIVLLDTRNRQEVEFGSFQDAVTLPIDRFTDLPAAVEIHRERFQGKTVVSFCTGGIRCEKAVPWMTRNGFENVLQLEGGILGYFEQVGAEHFHGECFVFDERVALDPQLRGRS